MGLLRRAIDAADRPGGRWLISTMSNTLAKLRGNNLRIRHDSGYWLYSSNGMTLPRGRNFDLYDYDLKSLAGTIKHYISEAEDCWFHLYKPNPGDVIVDVGAEIGTDTYVFSRAIGKNGRVIAIEAQPQTYEMLLQTCHSNRLTNVTTLNVAIADKHGEVRITSDAGMESNYIGADGELVPADTLDNMLREVPRIDLLKMNIEGAEQLAIQAMDQTVEKTMYLAVACHDFIDMTNEWFRTLDKVSDYLQAKGFTVIRRESDDREYVRYHLHAYRDNARLRPPMTAT
jgi:FkbM family methyltransferase